MDDSEKTAFVVGIILIAVSSTIFTFLIVPNADVMFGNAPELTSGELLLQAILLWIGTLIFSGMFVIGAAGIIASIPLKK